MSLRGRQSINRWIKIRSDKVIYVCFIQFLINDVGTEELTTGRMINARTNSPPAEILSVNIFITSLCIQTIVCLRFSNIVGRPINIFSNFSPVLMCLFLCLCFNKEYFYPITIWQFIFTGIYLIKFHCTFLVFYPFSITTFDTIFIIKR